MEELRSILWEYFGQLNELRLNIKIKPEDRIERPEALVRYEQAKEMGIPYVAGGIQDQPYIWMQEHGVIAQFLKEWDAVERVQAQAFQKQG